MEDNLAVNVVPIRTARMAKHRDDEWAVVRETFGDADRSYEMAVLLIRAHRALYGKTADDIDKIVDWLQTHNTDLGATPMAVILRTNDLKSVTKYLDDVRG